MKLLNRNPTEEMIKAAYAAHAAADAAHFTSVAQHKVIYEAMFDAAPERTVDMEPVGHVDDLDDMLLTLDDSVETGDDFYSATQLATVRGKAEVLQTENARLRKENEELKANPLIAGVSRAEWHDRAWALYHAKTFDDIALGKVSVHTMRAVFDAVYDSFKHEGEKHD